MVNEKTPGGGPHAANRSHVCLNGRERMLSKPLWRGGWLNVRALGSCRVLALLSTLACANISEAGDYIASDPSGRLATGDGPILAKSGTGTSAETPLGVSSRCMGVSSNRNAWMRARGVALSNARRVQCRMPAFIIIIH